VIIRSLRIGGGYRERGGAAVRSFGVTIDLGNLRHCSDRGACADGGVSDRGADSLFVRGG